VFVEFGLSFLDGGFGGGGKFDPGSLDKLLFSGNSKCLF
jgi:hypothetical protein